MVWNKCPSYQTLPMVMVRILEVNGLFFFPPQGYFYPLSRNHTRLKSDPSNKLSVMTFFFPAAVYLGKHGQTNRGLVSNCQGLLSENLLPIDPGVAGLQLTSVQKYGID